MLHSCIRLHLSLQCIIICFVVSGRTLWYMSYTQCRPFTSTSLDAVFDTREIPSEWTLRSCRHVSESSSVRFQIRRQWLGKIFTKPVIDVVLQFMVSCDEQLSIYRTPHQLSVNYRDYWEVTYKYTQDIKNLIICRPFAESSRELSLSYYITYATRSVKKVRGCSMGERVRGLFALAPTVSYGSDRIKHIYWANFYICDDCVGREW